MEYLRVEFGDFLLVVNDKVVALLIALIPVTFMVYVVPQVSRLVSFVVKWYRRIN